MKLISKEVKMDPMTFAPTMQVTIELPLEIMQDGVTLMGPEEVKKILGLELYDLLKSE